MSDDRNEILANFQVSRGQAVLSLTARVLRVCCIVLCCCVCIGGDWNGRYCDVYGYSGAEELGPYGMYEHCLGINNLRVSYM